MLLTSEIFTASAESVRTGGGHLFWAANPAPSLTESLREFGQTTPVLVHETEDGLTLIAGHARLAALAAAGQPVLARMVEDASNVEKGLLYLADNTHRILDDGMRLSALQFFAPIVDGSVLREDILPRLGVKPKSKDGKFLLAWLDMDTSWQALLSAGNIPLAAIGPLARMSADDRAAVEPLFAKMSWSRSNGVNVLTWLFETAKMTASTVAEVMDRAGMNTILAQGLSPKDAIARLTTAARQARQPELTRLKDRYAAISSEITTGTKWRMNQPDNFETGGSELTIQVKNGDQLAQAVKSLEDLAASPAWDKLWSLGSRDE